MAELADALDSKFKLTSGLEWNYLDCRDFYFLTFPVQGTLWDCFGPFFKCAGYKGG